MVSNSPQIHERYWSANQESRESIAFRNRSDWTIFFQLPRFEKRHCNGVPLQNHERFYRYGIP